MTVETFGIEDRERIAAALAVRFAVFVDEQHVPAEEEIDAHDREDREALHALVRDRAGRPIAAGRFFPLDATSVQVGRMAVARDARGRGIGRALLAALVASAAERGFARVVLNAQDHALGFYERAGFTPFGETLVECDILHQPMELTFAERPVRPA